MSESLFPAVCRAAGLPEPVPEHRFAPPRKWRFDWAWPDYRVALEIEGGVFIRGRHSRGAGMQKDMEKYNRAACLRWRIIRCTPKQFASGEILDTLKEAIGEFDQDYVPK